MGEGGREGGSNELQGLEQGASGDYLSTWCTLDGMAHRAKFFGKQVIARVKCLKKIGTSSREPNAEELVLQIKHKYTWGGAWEALLETI